MSLSSIRYTLNNVRKRKTRAAGSEQFKVIQKLTFELKLVDESRPIALDQWRVNAKHRGGLAGIRLSLTICVSPFELILFET